MGIPATVAPRLRCPTDDRILVRLLYQERVAGKLSTNSAPYYYCRTCNRVFPE